MWGKSYVRHNLSVSAFAKLDTRPYEEKDTNMSPTFKKWQGIIQLLRNKLLYVASPNCGQKHKGGKHIKLSIV